MTAQEAMRQLVAELNSRLEAPLCHHCKCGYVTIIDTGMMIHLTMALKGEPQGKNCGWTHAHEGEYRKE